MENPTGFDLSTAIAEWRRELLAQPHLTPVDGEELETHLRASIAELQARGLDDRESFWLACRRVGHPRQIAEEFVKADPARVWRERIFWVAVLLLSMHFLGGTTNLLFSALREFCLPDSGSGYSIVEGLLWFASYDLFLLVFAVLLARGRITLGTTWLRPVFHSRTRFITIAAILVCAIRAGSIAISLHHWTRIHAVWPTSTFWALGIEVLWPLALVGMIAWLTPEQYRETSQRA